MPVAALLSGKLKKFKGPVAIIITGRNVDMSLFTDVVTGKRIKLGKRIINGKKYDMA